jgi:hypothetical protein
MVGRLDDIDREIQRCMSKLDTQKRSLGSKSAQGEMDAELRALEAEVLGGKSGRTMLGMQFAHSDVGTVSYSVEGDPTVDIRNHVSCQSGGMYDKTPEKDVRFFREEHSYGAYHLFVYRTFNKDNEFVVCAVAVFQANKFVSYLFSTNDPLAFDNFNCFRGKAVDPKRKPALKCVEQLVFCENKVQLNLKCLRPDMPEALFNLALTGSRVTHGTLVNILKTIGIDHGGEILRISTKVAAGSDLFKAQALESVRARVSELGALLFYSAYVTYFYGALGKAHDLIPFNEYKLIGQNLFAVDGFLQAFEACGILCVMSARMRLLQQSPVERALVASLVPGCVVECSKDDSIWAYMVVPTYNKDPATGPIQQKLDWLLELDGPARKLYPDRMARLLHIIEHATDSQNNYISALDALIERGDITGAAAFLFNPCGDEFKALFAPQATDKAGKLDFSMHKLGLSERLLQALWTGQIVFPSALITEIADRMKAYGVEYFHYVPKLRRSNTHPLEIVQQIGVDHAALPPAEEVKE